jgi:hypothetical protein
MIGLFILGAIFLGVWSGLLYLWLSRPPCMAQRVTLAIKGESAFALEGILWSTRGRWLVLREVQTLLSDNSTRTFAGECVIDKANVTWIQVAPPKG